MSQQTLNFIYVGREIRSLVSRRRELMLFLGTLFAALGLYLQNILQGKLPPSLAMLEQQAFMSYSLAILVPTLLIAIRIAKLHGGMTINGIFYTRIRAEQDASIDLARAGKLKWAGVSTQLFLLTNLITGCATGLFVLALGWNGWMAMLMMVLVMLALLLIFLRIHRRARQFALRRIEDAHIEPIEDDQVENHIAHSLQDANHDMLATISFVGLILFSVFENLSGLGDISANHGDIASADVQRHGPLVYALLVTATSFMGIIIYLRLVVSVGLFSLDLDPSDTPFQLFKITDSVLGYWLLAFFLTISIHLVSFILIQNNTIVLQIDLAVLLMALLAYPITIYLARK